MLFVLYMFCFTSRRRHTRCALVTGVQTCALPIYLAGAPAKAYLDAYVISPGWQELSDPLKARVIRKTTELFRRGAKTQMLVAHPELREAEIENRLQRRTEGRSAAEHLLGHLPRQPQRYHVRLGAQRI